MHGHQASIPSTHIPGFLQLPTEITAAIISEVDAHRDLIALALTSRILTPSIIPQHTEYRVIRIRHLLPYTWAHLAQRADLAQHIREVHLCAPDDRTATDRYPTTIHDSDIDKNHGHAREANRHSNICLALGHMKHLQVFTWAHSWGNNRFQRGGIGPIFEDSVLDVISKAPSLKHLCLSGRFGRHVVRGRGVNGVCYPAWAFRDLLSLSLTGDVWVRPSNAEHVCRMMEQSPQLEHLELPMDFPRLKDLRFQCLKRLWLPLQSGGSYPLDASSTVFLENHPTIEELHWFPIGWHITLATSTLPSLKRLQSSSQVINALGRTSLSRNIECLSVILLDPCHFPNMNHVEQSSLRKLSIRGDSSIEHVLGLGKCFSGITWLSLSCSQTLDLHVWLHFLSSFPNLEVFRGQCIWLAVRHNNEAMHLAIMELVQLCPKLRQLDHCDRSLNRKDAHRIIIFREGAYGENVRYEIQRPPPLDLFDIMGGEFK